MPSSEFGQFLLSVVLLFVTVFVLVAIVTPPDPSTQVLFWGVSVPVVLVASYVLSYRRGFEWV
jgi:O-antigen/teichoic acid export membrane protein